MPTQNNEDWRNMDVSSWSEFFTGDGKNKVLDGLQDANQVWTDNRMILNLLFMIDVSGSMRGQRIGTVNYALQNIFKELKGKDDANAVIKVGVMEFSEDAGWITPRPVLLDDFVFAQVEAQPWLTNYAPAFDLLAQKLARTAFMDPSLGEYFAPVILFITDGEPTDTAEWPAALERLKRNGWFKQSAKYAIAVGEEARGENVVRLLASFTGDINNVRCADEGEALCSLIEYVAIRASEIQTSVYSLNPNGGSNEQNSLFDKPDAGLFSSMFSK